jgi:mRNA interferase MazF
VSTEKAPHRGEIWLVNLDPTVGREIRKTRPCVIIQNNLGNQYAPTTIIAPMTSTLYESPITVLIKSSKQNSLSNHSCINLAQIRCVDKRRLVQYIGSLESSDLQAVNDAIRKSLAV